MKFLHPNLYIGNDYENLEKKLKQELKKPFPLRKIIISPSDFLEKDLLLSLSQDESLIGIKIFQLNSAIDYLIRILHLDEKFHFKIASPAILSFHLECIIRDIFDDFETLSPELKTLLKPILDYVASDYKDLLDKRVRDLAHECSKNFQILGTYGGIFLDEFLRKKSWQSYLWGRLFNYWSYPYLLDKIQIERENKLELSVHLFGFSHLPKVIDRFFSKIATVCEVSFYFQSPTPFYYGDFLPEKTRLKLLDKTPSSQQLSFDELTKSPHILLSNWGKIFAKRQEGLEDIDRLSVQDLFSDACFEKNTLLDLFKKRLFLIDDQITLKETSVKRDFSIQIHKAPTKLREVQEIKQSILNALKDPLLQLKDVAIYVPDINEYYPYLKYVFQSGANSLRVDFEGLKQDEESEYLASLKALLDMRFSNFAFCEVFKLFEFEPIRRSANVSEEEVRQLEQYLEKSSIRFGFNQKHKKQMLNRFSENISESFAPGTWSYGFERLLFGLTTVYQEGMQTEGLDYYFPVDAIETSDIISLGKFIDYLTELFDYLEKFSKYRTLSNWCEYLKIFTEKFLVGEDVGHSLFLDLLKSLTSLEDNLGQKKLPFAIIENFISQGLTKACSLASSDLNAIYAAQYALGNIKPFKVVCFLGMDENFPRREKVTNLFQINFSKLDYFPCKQEKDRHYMLEGLLQAKDFLLTSYVGVSASDGETVARSSLLDELVLFLEEETEQEDIEKSICYDHPELEFDKSYFRSDYPFDLYDMSLFTRAENFYKSRKKLPSFFPEIDQNNNSLIKEVIPLQDLKQLINSPVSFYFKNALGVRIQDNISQMNLLDQEIFLSSLDKYLLRKTLNSTGEKEILEIESLKGKIPSGVFKKLSEKELLKDVADFESSCKTHGVSNEEFWTLRLIPGLEKLQVDQKDRIIFTPSPEISFCDRRIQFSGEIERVSEEGLLFEGTESFSDLLKMWPEYLIFVLATKPEGFKEELLIGKTNTRKTLDTENANSSLEHLLNYYKEALSSSIFFTPEAIEAVLLNDSKKLVKSFDKIMSSEFVDRHTKWCQEHVCFTNPLESEKKWKSLVHDSLSCFRKWKNGQLA